MTSSFNSCSYPHLAAAHLQLLQLRFAYWWDSFVLPFTLFCHAWFACAAPSYSVEMLFQARFSIYFFGMPTALHAFFYLISEWWEIYISIKISIGLRTYLHYYCSVEYIVFLWYNSFFFYVLKSFCYVPLFQYCLIYCVTHVSSILQCCKIFRIYLMSVLDTSFSLTFHLLVLNVVYLLFSFLVIGCIIVHIYCLTSIFMLSLCL